MSIKNCGEDLRLESVAINLQNVTKTFNLNKKGISGILGDINNNQQNQFVALDNISFTILKGETVGLIGLNGSGKTTLLRIISSIYSPDSGTVNINGNIAPLLQIGTGFNPEFNASENIVQYGMLLGFSKSKIKSEVDNIIEFAELKKFKNLQLKNYSTGMRAKLGFATALQVNPDILLVDEVLSVGDEAFREKSFQAFLEFKKNHKTVILSTHSTKIISNLCDRIILLNEGKIVKIGTPDQVIPLYKIIVQEHKNSKND